MKIREAVLVLFGLLFLVGCAVPGTYMLSGGVHTPIRVNGRLVRPRIIPLSNQVLLHQRPYQYRVGSYDILSIIVWNHPELTIPMQSTISQQININNSALTPTNPQENGILVDKQGEIFFPYAGRFKVSGLTFEQIRQVLSRKLSRYIRKPQVSIRVAVYNSKTVSVIGEVTKPGSQSLTNKPLNLMAAINAAGGINNSSADAQHIYVFRGSAKRFKIYWVSVKSPQNLLLAEHFYLRNNDIVYIAPAAIVGWNRIVSQIMPTVQTIWYTHAMTK